MRPLTELITIARALAGEDTCSEGLHRWESVGGRACPKELTNTCSQTVYYCPVCEDYDYGERGGPGFDDCRTTCEYGYRQMIAGI